MENVPTSSAMENVRGGILTDDQCFLLCFIMGTYFAPDLKEGKLLKSALQRRAEGQSLYNTEDLVDSHIKMVVIESVYYYVLRKADPLVVVKQPLLPQFIHGNLRFPREGLSAPYPQFNDLFPPNLHRLSQSRNQCEAMQSIVFINNPETGYITRDNIERFKKLTRLENFTLDRDSAILHLFVDDKGLFNINAQETEKLGDALQRVDVQCVNYVTRDGVRPDGIVPFGRAIPVSYSLHNASHLSFGPVSPSTVSCSPAGDLNKGTLFLPSCPSKEEWSSLVATVRNGYALTGTAARGHFGPVLGLLDIGESADSYLFRVSLPGVRRDERDFSCEVETNGRVLIKGVTVTGERMIQKYSQAFVMHSQNLCPPGDFSMSFKLPGPVDPQQFHGTFSTDGILEGIALKARINRC